MSRIYRWGFVGASWMAQAMAEDLSLAPGCQVAGVISRTAESAQSFAERFGAKVYASVEKMAADAAIDLIYVNSPNNLHYPQAKVALELGKPVLCEKPFTLNAAELEVLTALARKNKLFLMEAMWVRYLPLQVKLREVLASRAIGEPRLLRASFHSRAPRGADNRFFNPALGGGALLDLGVYPISFTTMVLGGPPKTINSHAQIGATGVDEHFGAVFGYEGGGMAMVSAGFDGAAEEDVHIQGTEGGVKIFLDQGGWKQRRMIVESSGKETEYDLPFLGRGYAHQAIEVARCLDAGELESQVMPLDESLAIMRVLDALRAQWGLRFPGEGGAS